MDVRIRLKQCPTLEAQSKQLNKPWQQETIPRDKHTLPTIHQERNDYDSRWITMLRRSFHLNLDRHWHWCWSLVDMYATGNITKTSWTVNLALHQHLHAKICHVMVVCFSWQWLTAANSIQLTGACEMWSSTTECGSALAVAVCVGDSPS